MGEFLQPDSNREKIAGDIEVKQGKVKTDVDGIFADGEKEGIPVFDVEEKDFNQNMHWGRKRVRFSKESNAGEYMRKTRYNIPFWIRNKNTGYVRKIKS